MNIAEFMPFTAESLGQFGDFVGGIFGTLISAVALIVIFFTWQASRAGEKRARIYQVFTEMMRTHENIVSSLRLGDLEGREAIADILSEFYCAYKIVTKTTRNLNISLPIDKRIDTAYTFTFFGASLVALRALVSYGEQFVREISDQLAAERNKNNKAAAWFRGHQNRLSHYFRNLYGAYRFIDQSTLPHQDKVNLGRALRTKLSNYEQALLALNSISLLGRRWETTGLLDRYTPIKNIPEHFFTFDPEFGISDRFNFVEFEWQEYADDRPWLTSLRIGRRIVFIKISDAHA